MGVVLHRGVDLAVLAGYIVETSVSNLAFDTITCGRVYPREMEIPPLFLAVVFPGQPLGMKGEPDPLFA